jgi:hypothetical protein
MKRYLTATALLFLVTFGLRAQTLHTITVKPSGGDYTTLAAAITGEAAIGTNLTAGGRNIRLEIACYAMNDTSGPISISGWTTDSTHFIKIYTPTTERHNGIIPSSYNTPSTAGYNLRINDFQSGISISNTNFVTIDGLALYANSFNGNHGIAITLFNTTSNIVLTNNIIRGSAQSGKNGIQANDPSTLKVVNNIIWNFAASELYMIGSTGTSYVYNNTLIGGATTLNGDTGSHQILKNNLVTGGTSARYAGTFGTSTNNAGDSGDTPPGSNPHTGTFTFVNSTAGNYLLSSGDTVAKGNGTNLFTDANYAVTIDILQSARPSTGAFDIGAHEVTALPSTAHKRRRIL